jgi:hypothetical protein
VYGTVGWLFLPVVGVLVQVFARREPSRISTLSQFGALLASRVAGRVLLTLLWLFIGLHLFARYTIPGH